MQTRDAFTWAVIYLGLWLLVTILAAGFVVGGLALDGLRTIGAGAYTPAMFVGGTAMPTTGLLLMVLGVIVWKFGTAVIFFRTVVTAIETETAHAMDTESMKSDILSVLDDRLADMHQDLSRTKQLVNRMSREGAAEDHEYDGFEDLE